MGQRRMTPVSFGGAGIVTNGRTAFFEYNEGAFNAPEQTPIHLPRVGGFPSFVRAQPEGKVFPLHIRVRSPNSEGQFREISRIFNPDDGLQTLIVEYCEGLRQVDCIPQGIQHDDRHDKTLMVPLWAPDPLLLDTVLSTATDIIDNATNPITLSLHNEGSYRAMPVFTAEADVQKLAAEGHLYMQEVAYASRSEFSLTGPGSGTWLIDVTNGGLDTATEVSNGRMQSDGRDIAVFVDEVEVPRERVRLAKMNQADTLIWIEIADAPAIGADLVSAIVAGTTVFEFPDEDHGFRSGDYLVWENDATSIEQARVTSIDGVNVTVTRDERNTTAGASAADTTIYRSGHHIQIAWGMTGLSARPTDPDPPLIDLEDSTNLAWFWGTAPIWPDNNRRPGGWRRIIYDGREDTPELRRNRLSAKTALDVDGSNNVRWADIEPTADRPNYDALEFQACCGVDDVAGAIEYDAEMDWPWCLQIIGRDLLGLDHVVFSRLGHEVTQTHFPPRIYTNQQETPSSILSAVIIRARNMIVTGCICSDDYEEPLAPILTAGHNLQGFHLEEETQIIAMVVRARDASGDAGVRTQINEVGTGPIFLGGTPGAQAPGDRVAGPFSGATSLGGSFRPICYGAGPHAAFTQGVPVLLPGDYFLSIAEVTGGAGVVNVPKAQASIYPHGSHWEFSTTWPTMNQFVRQADEDLWFAILGLSTDNQEDTLEGNRTNEELTMNDITIIHDPDRVPIVEPAAREDAYFYDTVWSLGTDEIHLRFLKRWADAQDQTVTIDVDARAVTDDENGDNIRQAVTVNGDPWLPLPPGVNSVSIQASNGAQGEIHTASFRSTWQA